MPSSWPTAVKCLNACARMRSYQLEALVDAYATLFSSHDPGPIRNGQMGVTWARGTRHKSCVHRSYLSFLRLTDLEMYATRYFRWRTSPYPSEARKRIDSRIRTKATRRPFGLAQKWLRERTRCTATIVSRLHSGFPILDLLVQFKVPC